MKKIPLSQLEYCLVSPKDAAPEARWLIRSAFECWIEVWSDTLRELDGVDTLFSDDFTRQTYLGALTFENSCLALGLFNEVDLSQHHWQRDSYFKAWPKAAIASVSDGPVLIGNQISVRKEYRGDLGGGVYLKQLLVGLMTETFLESGNKSMIGTMRVNKGMHTSAHDFGATCIQSGILHHGVEVELVVFDRDRLLNARSVDLPVKALWDRRKDHRSFSFESLRKAG